MDALSTAATIELSRAVADAVEANDSIEDFVLLRSTGMPMFLLSNAFDDDVPPRRDARR